MNHSQKYNDWKAGIYKVPPAKEQRISRKAIKLAEEEYIRPEMPAEIT